MDNYIEIPLAMIRFDIAASVRDGIDSKTVNRYAGLWRDYREELDGHAAQPNGEPPEHPFPPVKVAATEIDGKTFYDCVSGQHRAEGAVHAGMDKIRCVIVTGTPGDLLKMAIEENKAHGKAFTPADLRRCILTAREAFPALGCRPLAKMVGCSKTQVNRVLSEQDKSDKPRPKTKSKQKTQQYTEPLEGESSMTIPQFCGYVLDTIHDEADAQDAETLKSLNNLAVGIVKYLAEHDSVELLQHLQAAVNTSK